MQCDSMATLMNLSSESDSDGIFEAEVILYSLLKRKKHRRNCLKRRKTHGEFTLSSELSETAFTNCFNLNRTQFNEVHGMIQNSIQSDGCNAQKPIGTEEKLAVFLRYLTSGDSYRSIACSYRMGDRTVSKIVNEVAAAIWQNMQPLYLLQPTTEMWENTALVFEKKYQFPHCLGAIDAKHIVIKNPKTDSSDQNCNTSSLVLLASVDADYKFTTIDVGSMERFSDGNIFYNSPLGKKMKKMPYNKLHIPEASSISTFNEKLPYVFVSDEAFPLAENLMRPYPRKIVRDNNQYNVFNCKLSRVRQCVERAFGILASRFRIFRKEFEIKTDSIIGVVKAACVLHNYMRHLKDNDTTNIDESFDDMPRNQLLSIQHTNSRSSSSASVVRQKFTTYFNTTEKVS